MDIPEAAIILTVIAGTLRSATPLVFAGLGELINEKGGVLNLGIEGVMLAGACAGVAIYTLTGSSVAAVLAAGMAGQ